MRIEATLANLLVSTTRTRGMMLGLVWVLALLLTLPASPASAQEGASGNSPQLDWTRQFGSAEDDSVSAIAADSTGVYALVDKQHLTKYDTRGKRLWTRRAASEDAGYKAEAITTDSTGVYVLRSHHERIFIEDDPEIPGDDSEWVDVYNVSLRKYDASGNQMWQHNAFSSGLQWDSNRHPVSDFSLAADSSGVYTNFLVGGAGKYASKYSPSGVLLWESSNSSVVGLTAAYSAGIYSATIRWVEDASYPEHCWILTVKKHNTGGGVIWSREYYTSNCGFKITPQSVRAVAADSTGVYLLAGDSDLHLVKVDPSGKQLWTRGFGSSSPFHPESVAGNATGVYVAGREDGDAVVRKYDTSGALSWTHTLGTAAIDGAYKIAVDGNALYAAGETYGALPGETSAGKRDVWVARYQTRDADCNSLWTQQYGASGNDVANATLKVGTNDLYAAGSTDGTLPGQTSAGGDDAYVRKYAANGDILWTRQFGTSAHDRAYGLASDASGLYVVGGTEGTFPGQTGKGSIDAFVSKYDFSGNHLWTRQFGTTINDRANAIAADSSGVYVAGHMASLAFVRKYDHSGALLWDRYYKGSGQTDEAAYAIAADSTGVYAAGDTYGALSGETSAGMADAYVLKYDRSGNLQWTRQFGTSGNDRANALVVDSTGVYASGGTDGALPGQASAGNRDAFVRKYDSGGNLQWTRQFGTSAGDEALGITADGTGVYAAGGTGGTLSHQTSAGSTDAFVRKFGQAGSQLWTHQFGSRLYDDAPAISVDSTGLYAAGHVQGALPCQSSAGGADAYLTKLQLPGAIAAPYAPDLAPASDSGKSSTDDVTNDSRPTFTGFAESELTAQIRIMVDGQAKGSGTVGTGGAYTVATSAIPDGTHMVTAVAVDGNGNVSKPSAGLSVTVDATKPAIPTLDLDSGSDSGVSNTDNITNDSTPSFTGRVEPEAAVTFYTDGQEMDRLSADPEGAYRVTTTALADGDHSIAATATDSAGNVSGAAGVVSITIDTVAPPIVPSTPDLEPGSDSGVSSADNVTNAVNPWFTGTAGAGTTVKILADGVEKGSGMTGSAGAYRVRASSVAHGKRAVTAVGMDTAGNLTQPSVALSVTIDTNKPVAKAPVQGLAWSAQLGTTTIPVKMTWSATDQGSRVERYALARSRDSITWTGVSLPSLLAKSVSVPLEPANGYRFRVQARDLAGNWGDWAYGHVFDVIPHQEDSTEIAYTGAWTRVADANAYGGYTNTSTEVGAKATFTFADGENIGVVMPRRSDLGVVRICLDPGTATESCGNVDLSPDTTSLLGNRKLVWTRNNLDGNQHTVSITVVSGRVNLDAIVYLGDLGSSL